MSQLALFAPALDEAPVVYFASGSNNAGEIRGLDEAGVCVGVSARELRARAEHELLRVRGRVFVDSGAFSEMDFTPSGPVVVRPMDDAEWARVLALYRRLAVLGERVFLVAPDRIGNQEVTLERCARWGDEIRALRALGVRWIVPVQKGARSMADFARALAAVLGFDDFIRGIPSKKDATSTRDLEVFLRDAHPRAVHLLGLGPNSPGYGERVGLCRRFRVAEVYCDSVAVRALAGRTNGAGGQPRALTAAQDAAREDLAVEVWRATEGMVPLDYTDAMACPESWLTSEERARVLAELRSIPGAELPARVDLDAWLMGGGYVHPLAEMAIDAAWARFHARSIGGEVKRRAVASVFGAA